VAERMGRSTASVRVERRGALGWIVQALLLLAAVLICATAIRRMLSLLAYPYPHDGLEGTLLYEARLLRAGEALYQPLELHRFVSAPYPPLHTLALAVFDQLPGPHIFWGGRLVSVLAALGVALLATLLVRRAGAPWAVGALAGTLVLSIPPLQLWGTRIKPDLLALLWTSAGLYCASRVVWQNRGTAELRNHGTTEPRTKNQEPPINDHKEDTAIHQPSATSYQPTPGHRPSSIVHRPILLPLATLLALAGLAVSFSRGAWLGAAVAGAVLVAPRLRGRLAIALPILAAAGAVLVLAALTLRGGGGSEETRILLWREAVGYIARHPLGIGLDQFYTYHRPDSGLSLIDPALVGTSEEYAAHPHNLLLDIWLRMGPPGLAAFGWLIARMIRRARRSNSLLALGALAALAAALTHGLVDQFYFVPDLAITFWVLYGVVDDVPIAPTQL
jgi:hypothetical protein